MDLPARYLYAPAALLLVISVWAQVSFDVYIPADALHNYAHQGAIGTVRYKGVPLRSGSRVLIYGEFFESGIDEGKTFVDLKGTSWIGRPHGFVRCYVPASEIRKLQSESFVFRSMVGNRRSGVAIEGTIVGLNEFGNLEIKDSLLKPWKDALLGTVRENPAATVSSPAGSTPNRGIEPRQTGQSNKTGRSRCFQYAPARVNLPGTMVARKLPGPPNYSSIESGDQATEEWFLVLDREICTTENEENPSADQIQQLHLVFPSGKDSSRYERLLGNQVIVGGYLFHASTGHHRSNVILQVSDISKQTRPSR